VARARGYTLVVHRGHSDAPWASIAAALTSSRIDGAIFPSLPGMMAQLEHFSGRLVMRGPRFGPVPAADLDHVGGAETAVRYLRELGHQRIGYLWPGLDGGRRRHNTWRRLMEQDGLASTLNSLWVTCGYSVEQARLAALSLLRRQNRPTALLCDDEIMAAGVYKAARLLELSVPHDLSVLAFMDDGAEQLLEPELTTIDMPYQQLGALTMELMVEILAGRTVPDEQLVPTRLVVRGSTGPAPAAGDARLVPAGAR
jgi:LacI family transcriptional regulator